LENYLNANKVLFKENLMKIISKQLLNKKMLLDIKGIFKLNDHLKKSQRRVIGFSEENIDRKK
jgi:hypothetical protein